MDYISKYQIQTFINAHDTITLYGASRMAQNTKEAMAQIANVFVDIPKLQQTLGDHIAQLTHNEAAYIANSSAGAISLCTAVAIASGDDYTYAHLPATAAGKKILVLHRQHNCYDKAIEAVGAQIQLVGDSDELLKFDLEGSIDQNTAAIFYCPSSIYDRGALPIETVIEIAHQKGIPVIVDAAAQLPPIENLWIYTHAGADMVIFSGGKTLCGPQTSALVVGKASYIQLCQHFGSPMHGICRGFKTSKESMLGLCVAIENYMDLDHSENLARYSSIVDRLISAMEHNPIYSPYRMERGSVGQSYPRAFATIGNGYTPQQIIHAFYQQGVYLGCDKATHAIYLSPLNLTDEEVHTVCELLVTVNRYL